MENLLQAFGREISGGFPDATEIASVTIKVLLAALIGGLIGIERSMTGKEAGLRTHMLVCLGSAIFMMVSTQAGVSPEHLTRVIQGIATGIGFVGAGAILKLENREHVKGLTTAANIWLTSALGTAIGAGEFYLPTMGVILAWLILAVMGWFENLLEVKHPKRGRQQGEKPHSGPKA